MLSYPSGNRDEAVFNDPFKFDIARTPEQARGVRLRRHVCLGQHLARMEMRILWEELLPRLKRVELAGQPQADGRKLRLRPEIGADRLRRWTEDA